MAKRVIIGLSILLLLVGGLYLLTSQHQSHVKDSLISMPDGKLYQLFINHGMRVHEDFQKSFSKDEIIDLFRQQFDHIIETGHPRVLSHLGHMEMGDDVARILEELLNN